MQSHKLFCGKNKNLALFCFSLFSFSLANSWKKIEKEEKNRSQAKAQLPLSFSPLSFFSRTAHLRPATPSAPPFLLPHVAVSRFTAQQPWRPTPLPSPPVSPAPLPSSIKQHQGAYFSPNPSLFSPFLRRHLLPPPLCSSQFFCCLPERTREHPTTSTITAGGASRRGDRHGVAEERHQLEHDDAGLELDPEGQGRRRLLPGHRAVYPPAPARSTSICCSSTPICLG